MQPISQRLSEYFFDHKRFKNDTVIAKELGYRHPEKISRLFREGSTANPGVDILVDISNKFGDELSMDWVISGKGSMLKKKPAHYKADEANSYVRENSKEADMFYEIFSKGDPDVIKKALNALLKEIKKSL